MISQGQKDYLQTASKVFTNLCRDSDFCVRACYDNIDNAFKEYSVLSDGVYDGPIYKCPENCETATEEEWYRCLLEAQRREDLALYGITDITKEDLTRKI